jgi:hypothetical protein
MRFMNTKFAGLEDRTELCCQVREHNKKGVEQKGQETKKSRQLNGLTKRR